MEINKVSVDYAPNIYLGSILLTNQPDKCYHELSHRVIRCLLTNDYLNLDNFVETMKYAEAMGSVGRIFALEMAEVKDRILETTKSKTKSMLCACSDIVISESILF
jgi:hypothetical protein